MAKKPAAAPKEEVKETAADEPKFTVDSLVEATGLQPASVRVALRELGVEKQFGNKYGWNKKGDFDEVVKALKERSAKRVAPAKSDDKKEEAKPAPKGKDKPAAKGGNKKK
jgi:hypothetical protein